MYSRLPSLVLAFHGCDSTTYENVLYHHQPLAPSNNTYDWLGNGIYFWENSYERATDWAVKHGKNQSPAVIGAVIDLGNCLNLTDYKSAGILRVAYEMLVYECEKAGVALPVNRDIGVSSDLLIRDLDCAVIERLHQYNRDEKIPSFDSVRGVFIEGNPIYPNSGIRDKTHIQLCVKNPNCIKGYFAPLAASPDYNVP